MVNNCKRGNAGERSLFYLYELPFKFEMLP
jgi:hypothetical protein